MSEMCDELNDKLVLPAGILFVVVVFLGFFLEGSICFTI